MDARTLASLPPQYLAALLRDPRLAMSLDMQKEGSDSSPVKHPLENVNRWVKAGLGAYTGGKAEQEYFAKGDKYNQALVTAMQAKDYDGMIQSLSGNPDMSDEAFGLAKDRMKSDYEVNKLMAIERMKRAMDPLTANASSYFGGGASAPISPPPLPVSGALQGMTPPLPPMQAQQLAQQAGLMPPQKQQEYLPPVGPSPVGNQQNPVGQGVPLSDAAQSKYKPTALDYAMSAEYKIPKQAVMTPGGDLVPNKFEPTPYDEAAAKKDAETIQGSRDQISSGLDAKEAIRMGRDQLSRIPREKLGPIGGRWNSFINDPEVSDLRSSTNLLTLQAKNMLKFPSNNFSDADRNFLSEIAGGVAFEKEGLESILNKMDGLIDKQLQQTKGLVEYGEKNRGLSGYQDPRLNHAPPPSGGPKPGTIEDGYQFIGGNPADQNSWRPVGGQ